jgi:cell filamentation protein
MSDYKYLDPDNVYTDPRTGILRNKPDIQDVKLLQVFESFQTANRLEQLANKPIRIKNSSALSKIHKYLFQDVYNWAGKIRSVEISKQGKQFLPVHALGRGFAYIDKLIGEYRKIKKTELKAVAKKLAEVLDNINYLHPFREGNGRAQREFLRTLALEKRLTLNLNPPDNLLVYRRYMRGTIRGDSKLLTKLIFELIAVK